MKIKKTKDSLILEKVKLEDYLIGKVIEGNKTSSKIQVLKSLIGKETYIVYVGGK